MCKIMLWKWIAPKGSSDSIQLSLRNMSFIIPLVSLPVRETDREMPMQMPMDNATDDTSVDSSTSRCAGIWII